MASYRMTAILNVEQLNGELQPSAVEVEQAIADFLDIGPPPIFKVIASPYCEPGNMLIMDPIGTGIVDIATEVKHPGLKIIVCPTDEARDQIIEQARAMGLDLLEEADGDSPR